MRIFVLFSSTFNEWPLAIVRELSNRDPKWEFMGMVAGKKRVYQKVFRHEHPSLRPLYDLSEVEKKWMSTSIPDGVNFKYQEIFGDSVLNRIVASSRNLGYGWMSGAVIPETELMRLSQNSENVRRYVVGLLDFLFEVFENNRPDLVFCYAVADSFAFSLGKVCEHFSVPFRQLVHTRVGTKTILDDTPEGLVKPVCRAYERAQKDPSEISPFRAEARAHLEKFRSAPLQPEYNLTVTKQEMKKRALMALPGQTGRLLIAAIKTLVRGRQREWHEPTDWARRRWQLGVNIRSLKLEFNNPFRALGDFPQRPFAYFPLHVDPEASTLVLSPLQANQSVVIEALSKCLPFGMELVLKEHRSMVGCRPPGFYEALQRMPKVSLSSPSENPFELIKRADLICTITGTTAWEGIQLGKPVLVIGEMFPYLCLGQGVVHCPDFPGLPKAIAKALKMPPASTDSLELFIASILSQAFDFPATMYWEKVSREKIEAQGVILKNICDRLQSVADEMIG